MVKFEINKNRKENVESNFLNSTFSFKVIFLNGISIKKKESILIYKYYNNLSIYA